MSVFHLYAAFAIVPTTFLRPAHVGMMLVLTFLLIHYFYDHFLFREFGAIEAEEGVRV